MRWLLNGSFISLLGARSTRYLGKIIVHYDEKNGGDQLLSYDFIRMGSIVRHSSMRSVEFLRLLSDCSNPQSRNFMANLIIVEVDQTNAEPSIAIWPFEECGSYIEGTKNKKVFMPDIERALAFPFILPSGGNPLKPQGRYPVPSYLIYDAQFRDFAKNSEAIIKFVSGRISKTIGIQIHENEIEEIARLLHEKLKEGNLSPTEKKLGLMVLANVDGKDSPYVYAKVNTKREENYLVIGKSKLYDDMEIVVDINEVLQYFWQSTFQEGTVCGSKSNGICSTCHSCTEVVSGYNKSLSWLPTTWGGPLSFGNDQKLIESIALCKECYADLTVGANLFSRLSRLVDANLLKEIFSPVTSAVAKNHFKKSSRENIYGSMVALPLMDEILNDKELSDEWVDALYESLDESNSTRTGRPLAVRHMDNMTGFATKVPEEWVNEDFRLTLIYFSGDPGRLDIHLRAIIEDILPSTAEKLQEILTDIAEEMDGIMTEYTFLSEHSIAWKKKQIQTLPYLLATAFGAPYVWANMEKAFKRQYIDNKLFIRNISIRMAQEAKLMPDSIFNLQQESIEYFSVSSFLARYNEELARQKGGPVNMKQVKELINLTWETPLEELTFENIDELGFAAGQVIQKFGNSYYKGNNQKDFIKHRILTFGSSLTPDAIRTRALGKLEEYTTMLNLKVSPDVLQRGAIVSMNFVQFEEDINKNKDRFMAAFWAGYSLGRKNKAVSDQVGNQQNEKQEVEKNE